jgi:hypothetical protein
MTDYDSATVARFMTGKVPISEKFASRAATALGIPVHWLRDETMVAA